MDPLVSPIKMTVMIGATNYPCWEAAALRSLFPIFGWVPPTAAGRSPSLGVMWERAWRGRVTTPQRWRWSTCSVHGPFHKQLINCHVMAKTSLRMTRKERYFFVRDSEALLYYVRAINYVGFLRIIIYSQCLNQKLPDYTLLTLDMLRCYSIWPQW